MLVLIYIYTYRTQNMIDAVRDVFSSFNFEKGAEKETVEKYKKILKTAFEDTDAIFFSD